MTPASHLTLEGRLATLEALSKLVGRMADGGPVTHLEPTNDTAAALLRELNRPDGVANRGRQRIAAGAREDAAT